jgi:myo-inositol-hexaphosphate 3-phosphohydrolase
MRRAASLPLLVLLFSSIAALPSVAQPVLLSQRTLRDSTIADQDDMCFWLHPSDFAQSTIICSDKSADRVYVYDLSGHTLQSLAAQQPGNIDIRYGFPLGGQRVDIVALNERDTQKIRVYRVDPATRRLVPVDNGNIVTGSNYGFTLYRSKTNGKLYGFTGPSSNTIVRQYELYDDGTGHVAGSAALRSFHPGGTVEGMVADDETGTIYVSEEPGGVWKYGAEPASPVTGTRIATVGENGLTADVEGITIYYRALGGGYLLVSSQGNSTFKVYDRQAPHTFRGTFSVQGVQSTDGVDVINVSLSGEFVRGAFACHNGTASPYPVELVRWEDIATPLGLGIDTAYWDPRVPDSVLTPVLVSGLRAEFVARTVRLKWFVSETREIEAFRVHRAVGGSGSYAPLDGEIPCRREGEYQEIDSTAAPGQTYRYRLEVIQDGSSTWLGPVEVMVPEPPIGLHWVRVVPNPFASSVVLELSLDRRTQASIIVYDIAGHEVERLFEGEVPPGTHRYRWNPSGRSDMAPGVYLARAKAGAVSATTRVMRLR